MWQNQNKKAITLSFDDGITQDIRLVELLNRYHLKCTFNINTGLTSSFHDFTIDNLCISHLPVDTLKSIYSGHEVAVHSYTHPDLTQLSESDIYQELKTDYDRIKAEFGIEPVGMAYPFGTFNDTVVKVVEQIGLQYARTVIDSYSTQLSKDLLRLQPTCHFNDPQLPKIITEFINSTPETPQLLYIWGHSYECDLNQNWDYLERIFQQIAFHEDIFYGTNKSVLL